MLCLLWQKWGGVSPEVIHQVQNTSESQWSLYHTPMQNIVHALTTVYLAQIQMYKPEMASEYFFWTWQLVSVSSNPVISLTCERPQQRKTDFIKFSSAPGSPVFTFPPLPLQLLLLPCVPRFLSNSWLVFFSYHVTHPLSLTLLHRQI